MSGLNGRSKRACAAVCCVCCSCIHCIGVHACTAGDVKQTSKKAQAALPTVKSVTASAGDAASLAGGALTVEAFEAGLESLSEKRFSAREEGLKRIATALRASVLTSAVDSRCTPVIP